MCCNINKSNTNLLLNNNMSDSNKKAFVRAAMSGAIATLYVSNVSGVSPLDSVLLGGMNVPVFVAIGGSVALADFSANRIGSLILPHIPSDDKMIFGTSAKIAELIGAGLTTTAILTLASGEYTNVRNMLESFAVGSVSVAAADWSTDMLYNMSSTSSNSSVPSTL